jgi:gamma-glutamyltranspeptidase/glutathione hydrolase
MKKGAVATGNKYTTQAAVEILELGGNAYDAILAALYMAPLSEPVLTSLGGGGHLMSMTKDGQSMVYDFFTHTPRSRKIDTDDVNFHSATIDFGGATQEFHIGMGSISTPGNIAGVFAVHNDLGSLPMSKIIEPAVRAAREGIVIDTFQSGILDLVSPIFVSTDACKKQYASPSQKGELLRGGDMYTVPEYADMLEALASEGKDFFYKGEIAQKMISDMRETGGYLSMEDLASYEVKKREPIAIRYRDAEFITNPPPSSGGILIAFALKMLAQTNVLSARNEESRYIALLAEVMGATNKARVDALNGRLFEDHIVRSFLNDDLIKKYVEGVLGVTENNHGTTHMSVVDGDGNIASLTTSNGEGSGYIVPGTGIHLNNMLGEEDLHPNGFHKWNENERISSMMSPSVLKLQDGRVLALGSGGSNRIRTAILQVVLNLVDSGMSIDEAIRSPRIHFERDVLNVEPGCDEQELVIADASFADMNVWESKSMFFGGVHGVGYDPQYDEYVASGDERRGGDARVVGE